MVDEHFSSAVFYLDEDFVEANKEAVSELNTILSKLGMIAEIDKKCAFLSIKTNTDFVKKSKRNAGRKTQYLDKLYYLEEIEKKISETNADTVARELGISRATLFRRMKMARESGMTTLL